MNQHGVLANESQSPQSGVAALKDRLSKSSGSVEFHTYPQTKLWFFESDNVDAYNKEAAEEAWYRTIQFLKGKLT